MERRKGRADNHQLEREVLAGYDAEAAKLSDAEVHEGSAEHAAVDVLDEDVLQQRVHFFEVPAHLLRDGAVYCVEGFDTGFVPSRQLVDFIEVLGSLWMESKFLNFDQRVNGAREPRQCVHLQYNFQAFALLARRHICPVSCNPFNISRRNICWNEHISIKRSESGYQMCMKGVKQTCKES